MIFIYILFSCIAPYIIGFIVIIIYGIYTTIEDSVRRKKNEMKSIKSLNEYWEKYNSKHSNHKRNEMGTCIECCLDLSKK